MKEFEAGNGNLAEGECFAPRRLQVNLTRSSAQMRTRVCAVSFLKWKRRNAQIGFACFAAPKNRREHSRTLACFLEQMTGIEPA